VGQGLLIIDISVRHSTLSRTPLDDWSVHRRTLYITTITKGKHLCLQRDWNPRSQQVSDSRRTPECVFVAFITQKQGTLFCFVLYCRPWLVWRHWNFPHNLILTYSMQHSPSSEAHWFCSQSRNSLHFCNPNVHHRTYKCPSPVPILNQLNPVPTSPSYFLKNNLNIIPIYVWVSPLASFPHVSPPEPCAPLYPLPST